MNISKDNFSIYLDSVNQCYDKRCSKNLPSIESFPDDLFKANGELVTEDILDFASKQSNMYLLSVVRRIIAVFKIQEAREKKLVLDFKYVYQLVASSVLEIPSIDTVSSIGSQGFLSIPIFRNDSHIENFEFIRLHIWDISLAKYIDEEKSHNFSIHSHTFYAKSWIIAGRIINDRFLVNKSSDSSGRALFTIEYNETINEVNKHTSCAKNTGVNVSVEQVSHEIYFPGSSYSIEVGDFHKSDTVQEEVMSATFFSFTAKDGLADESFVIGPSDIESSEINRKLHISPEALLNKLSLIINS